ncbi:hypothetical protein F4678DRAFT_486369 [Xylaria arbuscula]|nr:hypothetical protein F4678DRAFT_486369 [Xylaria arbuscula]
MADADQQARAPLTRFYLFPELPTELRLIIWTTAMKTTPLQIHLYVWEQYFMEQAELRSTGMFFKNLRFQDERMEVILPFLHANSESRKTGLEQYSFVPFYDLIIHNETTRRPKMGSLNPWFRNVHFAINWREDTVFCNERCFLPDPTLPWAEHLRNATLLCMPVYDALILANTERIPTGSASDIENTIVTWAQDILPIFSRLKEITFAIKDGEERDSDDDSDGDSSCASHEISQWCERPFVPFPEISVVSSVLGSALDGGCLKFNKYPLEPPTEGDSYWWESLVTESMRSIKVFQDEINRKRPRVVLNLALDTCLIAGWNEDMIPFRSD